MRAAVLSNLEGEPAVATRSWPDPRPIPGWVSVRVIRAGLNRLDQMTVDERLTLPGPVVIGSDAAGVIAAVGDGVDGVRPGDEVVILPSLWWGDDDLIQSDGYEILGYPTQGTHAELVAVPAENVYAKATRLSWDETAALPLAGVTAWRALVTRGALRAGQTVVVTAASSGVGTLALQIACGLGARVVAVTSSGVKEEQARRLGAHDVVLRDWDDLASHLREVTGGAADLVVDSTGAHWEALAGSLRAGGRMVVLGKRAAERGTLDVRTMYWRQLSILGTTMGSPRDFAALLAHVDKTSWAPVVDSVYGLEDINDAYDRLNHEARFGKVVLSVAVP